jgi:hypothetical protein
VVLLKMMVDATQPGAVRVRAALGVLEVGLRLVSLLSLAERVAALEAAQGADGARH